VLKEQDPSQQCDSVYVRPTHFVSVCVDMKHDERRQEIEKMYYAFFGTPLPNQI
jgi:hypothetical protein